jgi:glycosyltransferase involved in cell wall biosynthesis
VLELAGALSRRHDVDLTVVSRIGDAARWPQPVAARAPAVRPLRLGWEQVGLPRVVRDLGVQVHHGPHYTTPLALGLPAVVTIHDLSFFTHPEWHQRTKVAFFRAAIRTSARHAAALIAVSATTAELLQHRIRPRAPVHVIPHGVDHGRYSRDGDDDDAALARAGVTAPYVAFVGTLEPRKDVPTLVRAFDRIAATQPGLTLVLAGARGWGADAVDAAVAAAAHGDRVRMTGYLPEGDLPALLRGAAAVAYPSLEEGFGLPVLEALACGAPVVTTSGTVMEEVAGGAAFLVPPGDDFRLAGALEAALEGDPERRELGFKVAARHTWEASAAGHAEVYRSVS